MTETVYLLGAGVNQGVVDWHGLRPPLANNMFQIALRNEKYSGNHYSTRIAPVYDYILRYWRKSKEDLFNEPFNLEECYTMLQLQQNEAEHTENHDTLRELVRVEFILQSFLAEFLLELTIHASNSDVMRDLGKIICKERPAIITFNYDLILESVIESASGLTTNIPKSFLNKPINHAEISDEELSYSHHKWNRPLGYGIRFDEVQLQRAGVSTFVRGNRFYNCSENQLYDWVVLKLHGSLNWFRYLPIRKYPSMNEEDEDLSEDKREETLLVNGRWWFNEPPDHNGWLINPLIITPVLYKEQFYQRRIFINIWKRAQDELTKCNRLVVIGYSFPPTDFNIKRLLLESFSENTLDELIVVNPDTSVVKTIKELCHFEKPVQVCKDLKEYLTIHAR